MEHVGPSLGLGSLLALMPQLGRNEARDLLAEFRESCRAGLHVRVSALEWTRPGTVWAMDHSEAPTPIDGRAPYFLAVRDLASHYQLAALPQRVANDAEVAAALQSLFVEHGAPLVLKSDNHGAFTGGKVRRLLSRWGVEPLYSPRYLPRYNGAVEAGIGHLKERAHILATRNGHPGRWTANDLEGARLWGNRVLRPRGEDGPTPEEHWRGRARVTIRERGELRRLRDERLMAYQNEDDPAWLENSEYRPVYRVIPREDGTAVNHGRRPGGDAPSSEDGGPDGTAGPSADGASGRANRTKERAPAWVAKWNARTPRGPAARLAEESRPPMAYDADLTERLALLERGDAEAGKTRQERGRGKARAVNRTENPSGKPTANTPTKADADRGKPGDNSADTRRQRRRHQVYYERLARASLSEAMVARGHLIIRKRTIPLPIKTLIRMKIS